MQSVYYKIIIKVLEKEFRFAKNYLPKDKLLSFQSSFKVSNLDTMLYLRTYSPINNIGVMSSRLPKRWKKMREQTRERIDETQNIIQLVHVASTKTVNRKVQGAPQ